MPCWQTRVRMPGMSGCNPLQQKCHSFDQRLNAHPVTWHELETYCQRKFFYLLSQSAPKAVTDIETLYECRLWDSAVPLLWHLHAVHRGISGQRVFACKSLLNILDMDTPWENATQEDGTLIITGVRRGGDTGTVLLFLKWSTTTKVCIHSS